jgi:hypothetical protein
VCEFLTALAVVTSVIVAYRVAVFFLEDGLTLLVGGLASVVSAVALFVRYTLASFSA